MTPAEARALLPSEVADRLVERAELTDEQIAADLIGRTVDRRVPSRSGRPVTRQDPVSYLEAGPCRVGLPLTGLSADNVSRRSPPSPGSRHF